MDDRNFHQTYTYRCCECKAEIETTEFHGRGAQIECEDCEATTNE